MPLTDEEKNTSSTSLFKEAMEILMLFGDSSQTDKTLEE